MSAQDHLKIAAAEMQKAVESLKLEISQLRNDETQVKQTVALQITQLTDQIRLTEQQINGSDDPTHTQQLRGAVRLLQTQINDKKHEMEDQIRRISDMIRQKESVANSLLQQARSVSP